MKISTKGIYALEAVMDLAMHSEGELVTIKDISSRTEISEKYLERIVGALKKKNILESTRGKFGGYRLGAEAKDINVSHILMAVEGDLAPVECLTMTTDCGIDPDCCVTRIFWNGLWEKIKRITDHTTLQQLIDESEQITKEKIDALEYYI